MSELTVIPVLMSSREIGQRARKEHKHVMRDIRKLKSQLGNMFGGYAQSWTHPQNGQVYEEFMLDKDTCLTLLAGYDAKARMTIIKRWQELESIAHEQKSMPAIPQTYAEALQLAADQARLIEEQKPKVAFVENLVERKTLMTATQVGQKHGMSAVRLNSILDEIGGVYSKSIKRARTFTQDWISKGYGELKQTESGHSQALFTPAGEFRVHELLISEGVV